MIWNKCYNKCDRIYDMCEWYGCRNETLESAPSRDDVTLPTKLPLRVHYLYKSLGMVTKIQA